MTVPRVTNVAQLLASLSDDAKRLLLDMERTQRLVQQPWVYVPLRFPHKPLAVRELALQGLLDARWMDEGQWVVAGFVLSAMGEDVACFLRDPEELHRRLGASRARL